jgi:Tfp pilus assembly protein PilP
VRKVAIFVSSLLVLSGCGFPQQAAQNDPCAAVRKTAERLITNLPDVNEVGKTRAKLEILRWAFIVTGDSQCFSDEIVATAKSAIALAGQA